MKAICSKSFSWVGVFILLNVVFWTIPASMAASHTPMAVVKSGTDQTLELLKARHATGNTSLRYRKDEIAVIVDTYFNFGEMAKRALGRPWKDISPEKQREFMQLFKELLFSTYVDRVDNYVGSVNERVEYDGERIEGLYALVKTRLVGYRQTDVVV
jgi:phospholipid transport system substrate-binding protein